ncbi:hypothetical protein SAMN05518861_13824 [Mesorhizobium sp. YR577]|nr:hypothetical protein SAMN05518861_13824 [Mesorhizobium sp. YR577]
MLAFKLAPEKGTAGTSALARARIVKIMALFAITRMPLLGPAIAQDLPVPMLIVRRWQPGYKTLTKSVLCQTSAKSIEYSLGRFCSFNS